MSDKVKRKSKPGDGTSLPNLVDAYRHQRDALRAQLDGLTALRGDLRAAAEREGRDIVEQARRDVDRALLGARQRLLALTTQVRAALEDPDAAAAITDHREVLSEAHRDLAALLDTSQPGLDALAADVRELGEIVGPTLQDDELGAFDPSEFPSESVVASETPSEGTAGSTTGPSAPSRAPSAPSAASTDRDAIATPRHSASPPVSPAGAPPKATDLSALVTELVARRTADPPTGAAPDAGEKARTGRGLAGPADRSGDDRLLTAAAMPVNRGVRLYRWFQTHSHLLPVVVGVAVTLVVVATWFRGAPDPQVFENGIVAVESDEAGTDPVPLAPEESAPAMRLEARREVWVQITVDGRQDGGRTLQPGDVEVITAASTIAIRAGDAGALWVSVHGTAAEPLGPDGGVLTRTFALEATPTAGSGSSPVSTGAR